MTEFIQWVNSKRVHHLDLESLDGSDFPVITKPVWTLTHQNADGSPSPCIGVLETPPDCHMGRITAGPDPGTITVTVTAVISPTAVATQTFKINVMAHPPVPGRSPTFRISQHRNGPMHH
jgi:hypothetical protein